MSDPWVTTRLSIGSLSMWLGTVALFAPRRMARLLGVDAKATHRDRALPLLVRLVAARNIAMGAALLVSPPPQAQRTTEVTLLLTAVDAAAVLVATGRHDTRTRSAVLSLAVLATAAAGAVHWHQDRPGDGSGAVTPTAAGAPAEG